MTAPESDGPGKAANAGETANSKREKTPQIAGDDTPAKGLLKPVLGFIANVTVITAVLVYFGWRRAETHAERIGLDESILGMTTQEYVLRSVTSVLPLIVLIAVGGLVWLAVEPRLTAWLTAKASDSEGAPRQLKGVPALTLRVVGLAWLILPVSVFASRYLFPAFAYLAFPASFAIGALLWVYSRHVRRKVGEEQSDRHPLAETALVGLVVAVSLFWTTSNYADYAGRQLAKDMRANISKMPSVFVYSDRPLHLTGPGVVEEPLNVGLNGIQSQTDPGTTYRYCGLRLLENTGGTYFLVSDEWSDTYGVVFLLPDDDDTLRFEFIRDRRATSRDRCAS